MGTSIKRLLFLAGLVLLWSAPAFAWLENVSPDMSHVLLERCTECHNLDRVNAALNQGRDINEIQAAMIDRGAVLSENEKQILGTFWGPASRAESKSEPRPIAAAVTEKEAREVNQIIETRCVMCHSRERIDEAIANKLPFEPIEQMMHSRGATLETDERQLLKIFWEQPHR